jgi:hypothetical protein
MAHRTIDFKIVLYKVDEGYFWRSMTVLMMVRKNRNIVVEQ